MCDTQLRDVPTWALLGDRFGSNKPIQEYENDTISRISTVMPDDSVFSWENEFKDYSFNEMQIAIAQHINGMMNEKILWTLADGFKDMSLGNPSWA